MDIDGTLRDERFGLPPTAKRIVEECRRMGNIPGLCTGRSVGTIQEDVKALGFTTVIAGGGSYIAHEKTVIRDTHFDDRLIRRLWQMFLDSEYEGAAALETQDEIFMNREAANILNAMNEKKTCMLTREQKQRYIRGEKIICHDNLKELDIGRHRVHKICLWCAPEAFEQIRRVPGGETLTLAQQGSWNRYGYYELVQAGCGKGDAVLALRNYLGIEKEDVISFGDGKNDIGMFKASGTAVAMKDSDKELLPYADSVCGAVMEDGIYRELLRRELI